MDAGLTDADCSPHSHLTAHATNCSRQIVTNNGNIPWGGPASQPPLSQPSESLVFNMADVRTRIKKIEVMVADTVRETHDTATLIFFTGNDELIYKPGHFVTIDPHQFPALERWVAYLEDIKGKP